MTIIVFSRQPMRSLSSFNTSYLKKHSMICWLEFDCVSVTYTLPRVSIPVIIEIRGQTIIIGFEFVEYFGLHFILLKSLISSQVSSMLRKTVFFWVSAINLIANLCLKNRFFVEFE